MLQSLRIRGFKSLSHVDLNLPKLAVLLGPNAAGKSNFLDALHVFSRLATERTLGDALEDDVRGYPVEQFTLPQGGLPDLLHQSSATFSLAADLSLPPRHGLKLPYHLRYEVSISIHPSTGRLTLADEFLTRITGSGLPTSLARIERSGDYILVRRQGAAGAPRREPIDALNHTVISDPALTGNLYPYLDDIRGQLSSWVVYYLDPRDTIRTPTPPREVNDIGPRGEHLAPFLYRLKHRQNGQDYKSVIRNLQAAIPSIQDVRVELDERRGTLEISVVQDSTSFSSRVVSEGTLRVLALCAIAVNPWAGSLIAFEEPENGVHPRRLDVIANLLTYMARASRRQVIVTTHSPRFAARMYRRHMESPSEVGIFVTREEGSRTKIEPFESKGPLFRDEEISNALQTPQEERIIEAMLVRGWMGS